jgi:iron(II)-dependent oxidoreductase
MLAQGRYALLLRRQIAANLAEAQFRAALQALEEDMALVPDGDVVLGPIDEPPDGPRFDEVEHETSQGRIIQVERFFLDRYPVTNAQYAEFVAAGGYEQAALWDPTILPAVLDFVDRTGRPGPRFWRDGTYLPGREDHPVVGVSWYEAAAYARWVGKRLPTDAEWVKAASWPVNLSATTRLQRRYPWGDTMDRSRANLWGSGPKDTVPVHEYASGASVGGVYQLVGNVWEWMRGNFTPPDLAESQWAAEMGLKSIRGGAYDTYFDNQATCQFQSGEAAVARKHNIGFRCAVSVCDLALAPPVSASASDTTAADAPPSEVPQ